VEEFVKKERAQKNNFIMVVIIVSVFFAFLLFYYIDSTNVKYQTSITYGEFPFSLEYEIDDQQYLIEDALIIDRIEGNKWSFSSYLKSEIENAGLEDAENLVLYKSDGLVPSVRSKNNELVFQKVKLGLEYVYFMNPLYSTMDPSKLTVQLIEGKNEDTMGWNIGERSTLTEDELYNFFGIKLITWNSPPSPLVISCQKKCFFCSDRVYEYSEIEGRCGSYF
jgi:hypothetical protein